jgi:hypothetical protein
MNSLDTVEAVMAFEQGFGVELPVDESGDVGSPQEMVDWLELYLSNQRPNKEAAALLRKLAKDYNNLNWLKAWKAHGDENKLQLSSANSSDSRVLSEIATVRNHRLGWLQ